MTSKFLFTSLIVVALALFVGSSRSEEITGYDAQAKLAERVIDLVKAWETGIRNWSGRVLLHRKLYSTNEPGQLLEEQDCIIDFVFDYVHGMNKVATDLTRNDHFENGQKVPWPVYKQTTLFKDDVYYDYQNFEGMPTQEEKAHNLFRINPGRPPTFIRFEPLKDSSWPNGINEVLLTFDKYDLTGPAQKKLKEEDQMTDEQIADFVSRMKTDGHPNVEFELNGDLLTFKRKSSSSYTLDLGKSAHPVSNKTSTRTWSSTLQEVSGFWIPKEIHLTKNLNNNTTEEQTMKWSDQTINRSIPEKEFSLASLGIRRGDLGSDNRTNTAFTVEGDEFLPSLEEQSILDAEATKHNKFRTILIGLGLLLILIGGAGVLRKRMKNTNPPS